MIFRDSQYAYRRRRIGRKGGALLMLKGLDGLMPKFYLMFFEPAFQGHVLVLGGEKTVAVGALAEELLRNHR